MADLSWTAETRYDCSGSNWIHLKKPNGSVYYDTLTGTTSYSPIVIVDEATSANDCTSGYILFTTSNGDYKKIPITRCLPDCNCSSIEYIDEIDGTSYEPSSSTVRIGTYSVNECSNGVGVVTGGIIFENVAVNNDGTITAKIKENEGNTRSDFYKITYNGSPCFDGRITQNGSVDDCFYETECTGATIFIQDIQNTILCEGGEYDYIINGVSNCWTFEDVYFKYIKGRIEPIPENGGLSGKIIIYENSGVEEITGKISFILQNVYNGREAIVEKDLTQEACCKCENIIPFSGDNSCSVCECSCDDLVLISGSTINVSEEGFIKEVVAIYSDCIKEGDIELTFGADWISGQFIDDDNKIIITVDENTDVNRNGKITITYNFDCGGNVECTKVITVMQEGNDCSCDKLVVNGELENNP